jgi:MbtH protein
MTRSQTPEEPEIYNVVVNHEEQYSIWPANKPIPEKWRAIGVTGTKEECLAHVRRVWTDMRPASVTQRKPPRGENEAG